MSLAAWPDSLLEITTVARASALSRAQFEEAKGLIQHFYPQVTFKPHFVLSQGDIDKTRSLRDLDYPDFFTNTLDQMVQTKAVHLAIHSAKDLPPVLPKNLHIAAITQSIDKRDAIVFASSIDLSKPLPPFLRVATSSKRREAAVLNHLTHPIFQDLRGTIEERLALIENNLADAVVVAEAALIRLNLTHLPRLYLSADSADGQGSLALVTHSDNQLLIAALSCLDSRLNRPSCLYLGIDPTDYDSPFTLKHCPIIKTINLLHKDKPLESLVLDFFKKCSHILITSPRTATYMWQSIEKHNLTSLAQSKKWLCIGSSSAKALGQQAFNCEVSVKGSSAEDMLAWIDQLQTTDIVLYPHSLQARDILSLALEKLDISTLNIGIYDTYACSLDAYKQELMTADELIFTSPSCIRSFISQMAPLPLAKYTAIGKVTMSELQKYVLDSYTQ